MAILKRPHSLSHRVSGDTHVENFRHWPTQESAVDKPSLWHTMSPGTFPLPKGVIFYDHEPKGNHKTFEGACNGSFFKQWL